ncbi:IQ domain-containing protein K-like [Rhopilema esculentum]|uniref:IQ domain-containing protein K-like n=1 Tax=Rhopilema esculentum TaxID=499914 RepID=UPI0031D369B5
MTDWAKLNPVFYEHDAKLATNIADNFDVSLIHPVYYGFEDAEEEEINEKDKKCEDKNINKDDERHRCSAKEYLEKEIFPVLLPALDKMLRSAVENDALKWKRTKFNACDYLTEYLYNNNPRHTEREETSLWNIPFVQRINAENPRPPLPLSLILTDEEAAIIIQSFWRGCVVRMDEEVQELRKYQKEMREQEYDIVLKVEDFWKKHPVGDESDETAS